MTDTLEAYAGDENETLRRLIEDQHLLTELQQHPGWQVLLRYMNDWLGAHEARLMSGHIDDLYEYKLTAGRTDGIRQILGLPEQVAKMVESAKTALQTPQWKDEFVGDSFTRVEPRTELEYATPVNE